MSVKKLSVVIPIYNERENIPILYRELKGTLERLKLDYEVVFVDDGSNDGSTEVLEELARNDRRDKVEELTRNYGQTSAMMAGVDIATGDVIITMDGDLQNDPADIPRLLEKIQEGYDLVTGWRKDRKDATLSRKVPSKLANWLIGRLTGVKIHDYGCTLKAYRSSVIKGVRLYGELHRFIPALATSVTSKSRIVEIPVNHRPRRFGKSKYGISRTVKVLSDLLFIWFFGKFMQKPIHFFGLMGMLLLLFGLVPFSYLVALKLTGHSIGGRPLLIISVLFILSGLQMLTVGIISEILMRIYYESQSKPPYVIRRVLNIEA